MGRRGKRGLDDATLPSAILDSKPDLVGMADKCNTWGLSNQNAVI